MALPFDTYTAYTQEYWDSKTVEDQVFVGNPLLKLAQRVQKVDMLSDTISKLIQTDHYDAEWIAKDAQITIATQEIGSKVQFTPKFVHVSPKISVADIELNKGSKVKIANLFDEHIGNAVASLKNSMEVALMGPTTGQQCLSYYEATSDAASYGGILKSDLPSWAAVTAEATYDADASTPVSPSLDNIARMVRAIEDVSGEKPTWAMTSNAVWDVLHDQYVATYRTQPKPNAEWGFDELTVSGVPIYHSARMTSAAFDATGATRTLCAGHQMMFVNEKYTYPIVHASRNFAWDPEGWVKPNDYDLILNHLWWWGTVMCTKKKANGRIFGIDPTLDPSSWTTLDLESIVAAYIPS